MRKDWKELFDEDTVAQANLSSTYPNIIRAWHRHLKGQVDYFLSLRASIKIGAFDEKSGELTKLFQAHSIAGGACTRSIIGMALKRSETNPPCCYISPLSCMTLQILTKNVDHGMTQHLFPKSSTAKKMILVLANLGIGIIHLTSD